MESISYILNENGKYTAYLINEEDKSYKLVQLSDRNIPFSKHEIVSVFDSFTNKTINKRLLRQDREKYYFEDGTEVEKADNFVTSKKPELKSGFYKGLLLDFYFYPIGNTSNRTVKARYLGENKTRIDLEGVIYSPEQLELSHSYFNVTTKIVNSKAEQLNKIFDLEILSPVSSSVKKHNKPTTIQKITKNLFDYVNG